jgi:hypothetical protein
VSGARSANTDLAAATAAVAALSLAEAQLANNELKLTHLLESGVNTVEDATEAIRLATLLWKSANRNIRPTFDSME